MFNMLERNNSERILSVDRKSIDIYVITLQLTTSP